MANEPTSPPAKRDPLGGCLTRIFWMVGGNLLLFVCLICIVRRTGGGFSWYDAGCAGSVILLLLARYVDIGVFGGQTATGEPATLKDWRRYALLVVLVAGVLWGAVHLIGRSGVL